MSYVIADPEIMAAAASDVAAIGSTVQAAHLVAAAPTVGVLPAAADEVSAGIAQIFSQVGQEFQSLAGQAVAYGQQFAQHLTGSGASYAAAEAVNAASIVDTVNNLFAPLIALPGQLLAMPGQIFDTLSTLLSKVEGSLYAAAGAALLSGYVAYELLLFSYLTLAVFIGLEMTLLKYLGISIPIP
ncbi:PE family protein [Mycobacterium sp. Marseille-P9652]|uniref:PE family protein n=1 Tax=Mycobacterium sp. Marseille-P9652 TaxID=2654950 RepID=UPI0012E7C7DB|nr:PE family protein [Mycobacterium sp. Marseille-P9652]